MQNINAKELAKFEEMGLTQKQVENLIQEMFHTPEAVKAAQAFLIHTTKAIRFDGQEIIYFRDVNNLINYLIFGRPEHPDHEA
jgi:hypothetical protein